MFSAFRDAVPMAIAAGSFNDCPETPSNAVGGFTGTVRECVLTGEEGIVDSNAAVVEVSGLIDEP
jgi:hypothetical protein